MSAGLYEKLGGEKAIDAVVERFYEIMLKDVRVKDIFKNTDMAHQRQMQKQFLNHVFGGKQYNGRNMREAHKNLHLTEAHFGATAENLVTALKDLKVPQELIDQVIQVVATTHDDVLGL
ncbi:hypothetical protein EDD86DRAFT_218608 [Gorgonomyces haynaldii]|nr:hypothetical protein EDD86DRAFT_218608 [Gorgonomyces haynaldii]